MGGGLPLCRKAVGVFYSISQADWAMVKELRLKAGDISQRKSYLKYSHLQHIFHKYKKALQKYLKYKTLLQNLKKSYKTGNIFIDDSGHTDQIFTRKLLNLLNSYSTRVWWRYCCFYSEGLKDYNYHFIHSTIQ